MKNGLKQVALKAMARSLNGAAKQAAGSMSCFISYEPKIPQALKKAKN